MSAQVLPFPAVRRQRQILRTASYMASLNYQHAEGHLRMQLRRLDDSLRRKGVAEHLIQQETASYECAVRATLQRLLFMGGGAA